MRRVVIGGAVLVAFLLPMYARTVWESAKALDVARAAVSGGDVAEGYRAYARAISWNSPLNSFAKVAIHELRSHIDTVATSESEKILGLEALREGLVRQQSPYDSPQTRELLREVRAQLTEIQGEPIVREAHYPKAPGLGQLVSQVFFGLWVTMVFLAIRYGIARDGTIVQKAWYRYISLAAVGYVAWLIALSGA